MCLEGMGWFYYQWVYYLCWRPIACPAVGAALNNALPIYSVREESKRLLATILVSAWPNGSNRRRQNNLVLRNCANSLST